MDFNLPEGVCQINDAIQTFMTKRLWWPSIPECRWSKSNA